jgi:hypothetical protein
MQAVTCGRAGAGAQAAPVSATGMPAAPSPAHPSAPPGTKGRGTLRIPPGPHLSASKARGRVQLSGRVEGATRTARATAAGGRGGEARERAPGPLGWPGARPWLRQEVRAEGGGGAANGGGRGGGA